MKNPKRKDRHLSGMKEGIVVNILSLHRKRINLRVLENMMDMMMVGSMSPMNLTKEDQALVGNVFFQLTEGHPGCSTGVVKVMILILEMGTMFKVMKMTEESLETEGVVFVAHPCHLSAISNRKNERPPIPDDREAAHYYANAANSCTRRSGRSGAINRTWSEAACWRHCTGPHPLVFVYILIALSYVLIY
mmetsp:Transcript_9796/g.17675  ORF Transcript_9796/g.17675 Transcript_9796/m.17675 type:complete len:191 (+) Transcript_9796:244-816(+)